MNDNRTTTFTEVAFTHFVPCLFIGVALLFLLDALFPRNIVVALSDDMFSTADFAIAALDGLFVAAIIFLFHTRRNRRLRKLKAVSRLEASPKRIVYAVAVGFISGAFDVLLGLHNEGIMALTFIVLGILIWHLRIFAVTIVDMLRPGNVATWGEVAELLRIYLTMLAGFTLVNATLEGAHLMAGQPAPFGFTINGGDIFLNSLYYTVVTMTTLGFGDIVPTTWDGKLLLIFQCMAGYVMFALMIGIITRGVVRATDTID